MLQEGNRSVVVGVDFRPGGDHAILESVRRLAEGRATALHAVHVRDPSEASRHAAMPGHFSEEKFLEQGPRAIRQRIEGIARAEAAALPPDALQVHARVGKTADVLLQLAVDYDADLIVVGSHSRQGVERLLGPVSELLVRTATCSVLVASSKSHSMIFHKAEHSSPSYPPGEVPATARPLPVGGLPRRS